MRKIVLFSCLSIIFLMNTMLTNENIAYGHGFQYHCSSIDVRLEDQVFLKANLQKNESNIIMGKVVNLLNVEQEISIGILLYENNFVQRVNYEFSKILKTGYGMCIGLPYNGNPEFYFDVEPSFTQKLILQPNEVKDYKIEITPLKSGTYHIHSALYVGDLYRPSVGQTITVEGNFNLSERELFQFYIPFYFSVMLILIGLTTGIFLLTRKLLKRTWVRTSKIFSNLNKPKKNFYNSLNPNQGHFVKVGSIIIFAGIVIQGFTLDILFQYPNLAFTYILGVNYQFIELHQSLSFIFKIFLFGISLSVIGLTVLILGIKKEPGFIHFLNLIQKPFLKIQKRKAVESGIVLGMIGTLLIQ